MVKGPKEFRINNNVKIGQFENGMHWAENYLKNLKKII